MSLELRGVEAGYDGTLVLKGIDLVLPPGTVAALIGPNGAGKTTLLRVASGLLRVRRGSLRLDGVDVAGMGPHELVERGLCHIPEGRGVFPALTVRENLRIFARKAGLDEDSHRRATSALPILERRADQAAGTLSGGEQQMLALARAYLTQPRYVLLDEVSMGLAPRIVDEIFEFLAHLVELGCALLLVEQYVERALAIADVAYVLRKGQVAFVGQPGEIDTGRLADEYLGGSATNDAKPSPATTRGAR